MTQQAFLREVKKNAPEKARELRLINLRLRNFKGIKEFDLNADGKNLVIRGDNACGKTTIMDSFFWLVFGKDSQHRSDFELKRLTPTGEPIHGLSHEVEAEIEINEESRTFKKALEEKWTKKRGSAHREFTGHTTNHFVDGVPVKQSEYQDSISEIADEQTFRLLTDPTYFSEQLHWQDRRKILLEVCGDVSDEEVCASSKELAELPGILGDRTMDQHRKVITARRQEINRELDRLPIRIDECERGLPELPDDFSLADQQKRLAELTGQREELEAERSRIQTGGQIAEKKRELAEIQAQLLDLESQARKAADKPREQAEEALRKVRNELAESRDHLQTLNRKLDQARQEIESVDLKLAGLRDQWQQVDAEQLEFTGETVCHACGQDLPADRIEEAHQKALEAFNKSKSKRLTEINEQGRRKSSEKKALEASIEMLAGQIHATEARVEDLQTKVEQAKKRVDSISDEIRFPKDHTELATKRDRIQKEIDELHASAQPAYERAGEQIKELGDQIADIERKLQSVEQRRNSEKRINELRAQEKELAVEFEKIEHQIYLIELFIREKVSLLESKINDRFELARFKLFAEQINGGLSEICETSYLGVPWGSLNTGSRLNVGIDILNTLSGHYGFAPCVFIDGAESVTNIIPTCGQSIKLVVSAEDSELRVEKSA